MSNTPGLPNSAPWNDTISKRPSKSLIKPPYQPDVSGPSNTPQASQYSTSNSFAANTQGAIPQGQDDFQIPPFMLADMQRAEATSFPSTDPVVDLHNQAYRSKIDSLKHVAIMSQNSVRQNVQAARPQSMMVPTATNTYANDNSYLTRHKPVTASLHPAALFQQQAVAMPNMPVRVPQQQAYIPPVAPSKPVAPPVQREMPPHSSLVKFLLMVLLIGSFIPTFINIVDSISLYTIADHGYSGIQHLLHVRTLADDLKAHPTNLDINKLKQIQSELQDANQDFTILHTELTHDTYFNAASYGLPQYTNSILALSKIGADASDIGQALTKMVIDFAPTLHSSALAASSKPLVTQAMLDEVQSFLTYSLPLMHDIQSQTPLLSLDALPINSTQREQISEAIQLVPLAITDMEQAKDLMSAVGWILGVGQPRTFLVQTMDRAELRPTGGFTGQFGELKLNGGRMGPFKLQNIALFEYGDNAPNNGKSPPAAYQSWWPIANWGVRDSNLSADFPTSATITMNTYQYEFHDKVDGLIVFSPFLISRILAATGPIFVPKYNETITADNVESRLHYYQLDNTGIRKEELIEHVYNGDDARKLFTGRVTQLLMDKIKHAQVSVLVGIAHEMLTALKTRDLQVYVSNAQIENLLVKYDAAAVMDRSTTQDGLFVVQANVSANKGSQYVQTLMQDQVTLDKNGGATHQLQIHLIYHVVDQIYGPDTYHDYIRVYVPPNAQFLDGNGFEQLGHPYCSSYASLAACPTYDAYGDGDLMCPANQSDPMVETNQINDPYVLKNHPLNEEGAPTNMVSDEPQRAMYAGWVLIPKNCDATVTLSWYVPATSHDAYSLTVQRQSGTYPVVDVTILPTPSDCSSLKTSGQYFHTVLSQDQTFSLVGLNGEDGANNSCYVQPKL